MAKKENKAKKHFFKDFKAELKKVIWPTPKQLANNTSAVVAIVLITAVIVFALDVVFDLGNKYGITHLQNVVNEKYNNTDNNTTTDDTDNTDNGDTDTNSEEATSEENTTSDEENTTEENTSTETEQTNPEQ